MSAVLTSPTGGVVPLPSQHAAEGNQRVVRCVDSGVETWTPPTWDEVVRQHSARVFRLAFRLTGNRHDAEDLTQ
jgi:Sigma-70 region 2